jgi:peptidoglycan/xylan/chitin deacetylase (PgdA/CDA1 family)
MGLSWALVGCALEPPGDATLGLFGNRDPRVFYSREIASKLVALTIDDAPDSQSTAAILDALRDSGAHATFFVISDQLADNESVMDRLVSEGHELGNHMTTDETSVDLEGDEFRSKLGSAQQAIGAYGPVRWFRPGGGYYDEAMLDAVEAAGLRCALGTVYPLDAQLGWGWTTRSWIRWRTKPGAVIILHDRGPRGLRTAHALRRILPALRERGYEVVTLSQLADFVEPGGPAR